MQHKFVTEKIDTEESVFQGKEENIQLEFLSYNIRKISRKLFQTSCSEEFLNEWNKKYALKNFKRL